jgi:hypothetical protein
MLWWYRSRTRPTVGSGGITVSQGRERSAERVVAVRGPEHGLCHAYQAVLVVGLVVIGSVTVLPALLSLLGQRLDSGQVDNGLHEKVNDQEDRQPGTSGSGRPDP